MLAYTFPTIACLRFSSFAAIPTCMLAVALHSARSLLAPGGREEKKKEAAHVPYRRERKAAKTSADGLTIYRLTWFLPFPLAPRELFLFSLDSTVRIPLFLAWWALFWRGVLHIRQHKTLFSAAAEDAGMSFCCNAGCTCAFWHSLAEQVTYRCRAPTAFVS